MTFELPLMKANRLRLARAFRDSKWVDLAIDCVLEGQMGRAFVDDLDSPAAFMIVAALSYSALGESISDYKGLAKRSPFLAFSMLLLLFSLAGIPPLGGFASKVVLFSSAIEAAPGAEWLVWLAVAAIINSAISLYYYVRVVKYMYGEDGKTEERIRTPAPMFLSVLLCVLAIVFIGLFPETVLSLCEEAARTFFAGI